MNFLKVCLHYVNISREREREREVHLVVGKTTFFTKVCSWFYNIFKRFCNYTKTNLTQSGSLYSEGMRPLLYSEKDAQEKNIGWVRAGTHIKYYKNDIK